MKNIKLVNLEPENSPVYSVKTFDELAEYGRKLPKKRWLLDNFIREKSLVHFPSERGTGKTFFLMQLCLAISKNMSQFCGERIGRYGNTLYLNFEMDEDDLAERLNLLYQNPPYSLTEPGTHDAHMLSVRADFKDVEKWVVKLIKQHLPVLVVLDNFSIAFTDIEKRPELAKTYRHLLDLKNKLGFALIIVDHTKKGVKGMATTSDLQSGSGIKSDLSEEDMFLRFSCQSESYRIMKKSKFRFHARKNGAKLIEQDPKSLWFKLIADDVNEMEHLDPDVAKDMDTEVVLDVARDLNEKGHSFEKIGKLLGIPKSTLHRKLSKK